MKERIYIAGPYSARDCDLYSASRIIHRNLDQAISIGNAILLKGHYTFVPHLSHYQDIHRSMTHNLGAFWYEIDNTFIDHWATALFYIAPSYGADMELKRAQDLGLKIYHHLHEVESV